MKEVNYEEVQKILNEIGRKKKMKKRLRLNDNGKALVLFMVMGLIIVVGLFGFQERMEKIESGEMVLVEHNAGDR